MDKKALILTTVFLFTGICYAQEQFEKTDGYRWNVKSNLLYDATSSFNLGVEFGLGEKSSIDISGNYNPWTLNDNMKWKHALIQPELRFWTRERYRGFFWGPHAHYALYNVGGLDNPPFSAYMRAHRFEGWLAGAGVSTGYRWNLSGRVGLEAVVGAGYAYMSYDKYDCTHCGKKLGSGTKNYFGPTKVALSLIFNMGKTKKQEQAPVQPFVYEPPVVEKQPAPPVPVAPSYGVTYTTPEVETIKIRSEKNKAYLDFIVGGSEIVSSFKNNTAELGRMRQFIETMKNSPGVRISSIVITGYASPEGIYAKNLSLSGKRAASLKDLIKALYGFPDDLFAVSGKGEDWLSLDSLVSQSDMADKYRILEIIRNTNVFDGRERQLMEFNGGGLYRQMKEKFFPLLRRTEYELHYTVLPFTVEQGKEVIQTCPASLSLNEMFQVANAYTRGSKAFNEVFETAARIFPGNDTANLNAVASALERKNTVSAADYLSKVKVRSAAYYNNAGVLHCLKGEYKEAIAGFEQARTLGDMQAAQNLLALQEFLAASEAYGQTGKDAEQ